MLSRRYSRSSFRSFFIVAFMLGGIVGYGTGAYQYQQLDPLPVSGVYYGRAASERSISSHREGAASTLLTSSDRSIEVRFSPNGQCTALVEESIGRADNRILVQAYGFTSLPIAEALIAAHKRGVEVRVLVDRSQVTSKYSQVRYVMEHGIDVVVDKVAGIAHNKVMIIDDEYVITGSFNWTQAAETRNAENILLIRDSQLNQTYAHEWGQRAARAKTVEAYRREREGKRRRRN